MNDVLCPYLDKFASIYFDDILVYSTSMEEYIQHLRALSHHPDLPSLPSATPPSGTSQPASVGSALHCRELYCPKCKRTHADHGRFATFNHSCHRYHHCGMEFQLPVPCVSVVADMPPEPTIPDFANLTTILVEPSFIGNVSHCSFDPRDPEMCRFVTLAQSP